MIKGTTPRINIIGKIHGIPLEKDAYDEIEVQFNPDRTINSLKLLYTEGRLLWDDARGNYYVVLTESETMKLSNPFRLQVRILNGGKVIGSGLVTKSIEECLSKRILGDE